MRRVDPNEAFRAAFHPDEGASLGAVSVQDIRLQSLDQVHETRPYQNVRGMRFAANGYSPNAKFEAGRDFLKRCLGAFAAGQAVGDNADMVAAVGLSVGEVQDVTEDSADRRAHRMQDTKRLT